MDFLLKLGVAQVLCVAIVFAILRTADRQGPTGRVVPFAGEEIDTETDVGIDEGVQTGYGDLGRQPAEGLRYEAEAKGTCEDSNTTTTITPSVSMPTTIFADGTPSTSDSMIPIATATNKPVDRDSATPEPIFTNSDVISDIPVSAAPPTAATPTVSPTHFPRRDPRPDIRTTQPAASSADAPALTEPVTAIDAPPSPEPVEILTAATNTISAIASCESPDEATITLTSTDAQSAASAPFVTITGPELN
eukprot:CAMPEP_0181189056 /NCGR_PEP_ID=MMETSP1096-20121128/11457_1 /TAXON_ID=156174 ORGANISM="Chrysochromulina ericina, Strain CCMP281" /NCGR_SAMPLE_ID=MMETSP1096 /ASSEMBLY_ACC=CAM_ASM_000453 /LENGTH=248 /DNA_ID=CAMNT_0023278181 /DNA_START=18 /DNA_END=765 /DNA_ORIENTATION=-